MVRKGLICALLISLCLVPTGCGGRSDGEKKSEALALETRTSYIAMTSCAGQAAITADYGERVYEYVLSFAYGQEEGLVLTLTEPEALAGITARVREGETTLEFDGVMLETGPLSGDGFSPIDALPALFTYAKEGYIASCGMETLDETECLYVLCRDPDNAPGQGTEVALWFDAANKDLVRGEISTDGFVAVHCQIWEFSWT